MGLDMACRCSRRLCQLHHQQLTHAEQQQPRGRTQDVCHCGPVLLLLLHKRRLGHVEDADAAGVVPAGQLAPRGVVGTAEGCLSWGVKLIQLCVGGQIPYAGGAIC